eukprot:TRINITY_DN33283_c0_g1_i1.p1 TRINITY_DN33283_c0_g1~~TRINITY_DN33283_c0_g1_i1.p1  ORF type:complete len:217 (-),score=35.96 TRINITY_DN33283_c0_g1_i1:43-672(-)
MASKRGLKARARRMVKLTGNTKKQRKFVKPEKFKLATTSRGRRQIALREELATQFALKDTVGEEKGLSQVHRMQHKRTMATNFTRVGLAMVPVPDKKIVKKQLRNMTEDDLQEFPAPPEPRPPAEIVHLNETELLTACQLLLKYGTNYKAMSRDKILNPFQKTPRQLEKMAARVLSYDKDTIQQHIPEEAFELLQKCRERFESRPDDDE